MKTTVLIVKDATQAKLVLRPGFAIIKIPGWLTTAKQIEVRDKLMAVIDKHSDTKEFLKIYYKIGEPYLFLNRKLSSSKRETIVTYKYDEL
jgi:hypothetical protein